MIITLFYGAQEHSACSFSRGLMWVLMRTHTHTHLHTFANTRSHAFPRACLHTQTHLLYEHTHTHTHTHTYTHRNSNKAVWMPTDLLLWHLLSWKEIFECLVLHVTISPSVVSLHMDRVNRSVDDAVSLWPQSIIQKEVKSLHTGNAMRRKALLYFIESALRSISSSSDLGPDKNVQTTDQQWWRKNSNVLLK